MQNNLFCILDILLTQTLAGKRRVQRKFICQLKCNICILHRAQCRMYSTEFNGVQCDKWMRDINFYNNLSTFKLHKYRWFLVGWLQPQNGFE